MITPARRCWAASSPGCEVTDTGPAPGLDDRELRAHGHLARRRGAGLQRHQPAQLRQREGGHRQRHPLRAGAQQRRRPQRSLPDHPDHRRLPADAGRGDQPGHRQCHLQPGHPARSRPRPATSCCSSPRRSSGPRRSRWTSGSPGPARRAPRLPALPGLPGPRQLMLSGTGVAATDISLDPDAGRLRRGAFGRGGGHPDGHPEQRHRRRSEHRLHHACWAGRRALPRRLTPAARPSPRA